MKKRAAVLMCFVSFCFAAQALGDSTPREQLRKAAMVIKQIMDTPDQSIPSDLLDKAVCVGVVPAEIKFAFIFGGHYGRGVLVCRRHGNGPWGAPSLFTLGGGSFGFQIGGKETDVVFIVMNPDGVRKLLANKVELGAGASVAAGPVGRSAGALTDAEMQAKILSYSRSHGVFAGVALKGAVLTQDNDDNEVIYGRPVSPKDILIEDRVPIPPAARPLDRILTKYSPHGGAPYPED